MGRTPTRSESGAAALPLVALAGSGLGADEVELGHLTGVFGFRGEIKVYLHNPESDLLRAPRGVTLIGPDDRRWSATMSVRPGAGQKIVARLAEVSDEATALRLSGFRVAVPKAALPDLDDGEYYVWQLEGAEVRIDDRPVGRVIGVQDAGPHDVFEIDAGEGTPVFVPALREFVVRVDAAGGVVHLAPGALDEDHADEGDAEPAPDEG